MINHSNREAAFCSHKNIVISMRIRSAGGVDCLHASCGIVLELDQTVRKFGMFVDQCLEKIVGLTIGSSVVGF